MAKGRPAVRYVTASGEEFRFSSLSSLYSDEAHGWKRTASGGALVAGARTLKATLGFAAGSDPALADRLLALCWSDMDAGDPGELWVGDWRLRCHILELDPSKVTFSNALWNATLYAPDPLWRRDTKYELRPNAGGEVVNRWLAYPRAYPHGYGSTLSMGTYIEVPGPLPCDLKVVVYGPAKNPRVAVGDNVYGADVEVGEGCRLVIDPAKRRSMNGDSVVLVGLYGDQRNVFDKRLKGVKGSGTYVFEQVPPGRVQVSWPQSFGVDLYAQEARGALPWS